MPQTHDSQPQPPHVGVLTGVQPFVTVHGPQSCGQEPQLSLAGSHLPSPQTGAQAPQS